MQTGIATNGQRNCLREHVYKWTLPCYFNVRLKQQTGVDRSISASREKLNQIQYTFSQPMNEFLPDTPTPRDHPGKIHVGCSKLRVSRC